MRHYNSILYISLFLFLTALLSIYRFWGMVCCYVFCTEAGLLYLPLNTDYLTVMKFVELLAERTLQQCAWVLYCHLSFVKIPMIQHGKWFLVLLFFLCFLAVHVEIVTEIIHIRKYYVLAFYSPFFYFLQDHFEKKLKMPITLKYIGGKISTIWIADLVWKTYDANQQFTLLCRPNLHDSCCSE